MTFDQFCRAAAIAGDDPDALRVLFDKTRESAVHDLAKAIEQRDRAVELLHKHYTKQQLKSAFDR